MADPGGARKKRGAEDLGRLQNKSARSASQPCPSPVPRLFIRFDAQPDTTIQGAQDVVVGERVHLRAVAVPPVPVTSCQWTVTGHHVGAYSYTRNAPGAQAQATVTPTETQPADAAKVDLVVHWIAGGNRQVTLSAVLDGSMARTDAQAAVTFRVQAPQIVRRTARQATPNLAGGMLRLRQPGTGKGITFRWEATGTALRDGKIQCTQLVRTADYWIADLNTIQPDYALAKRTKPTPAQLAARGGQRYMKELLTPTGGAMALDTQAPYDAPVPLAAGQTARWDASDTPGTQVHDTLTKLQVVEDFELYYMYKSDQPGSIWVTLAKLDWNWRATLERNRVTHAWDNPWPTKLPGANQDLQANPSHELPVWNAVADGAVVRFDSFGSDPRGW